MKTTSNGKQHEDRHFVAIDHILYQRLAELAKQSRQSVDDLAAELLSQAIHQRKGESTQERWRRLTRREQEIIALYCLGYTSSAIGKRFTLSDNTIRSHIYNAMNKLGVSSRGELRGILSDWDFASWLGIEPEDLPGFSQSYLPLPGMEDPRNHQVQEEN
jgi:DNA-binding NarL/FixJ family response regulator